MKTYIYHLKRLAAGMAAAVVAVASSVAMALPASHYAESSALASGNWAKIKVKGSGMQFISNSQLSSLGFSDPSKVKVYGYGGRIISEKLDDSQVDDLPVIPSVKTSAGIVFFGVDHLLWQPLTTQRNYSHTMQPYAEESFYFLSDKEGAVASLPVTDASATDGLETADSFVERLVHEQELFAPSVTGRTLLGEDLRGSAQQFSFALPGNVGGDASAKIVIGSNISNANGTVSLTSSNSRLSQGTLSIEALRNAEQFMRASTFNIMASNVGENLQLGMQFSSGGVINLIRLDYIEVEYERALTLPADRLYFYYNESMPIAAELSGITAETELWDVTVAHAPRKVTFARNGSKARFRVEPGYHEYVAFNPSRMTTATVETAGPVQNQNLHALESPDMLIITPAEYMTASDKVANLHREQDGMKVTVLTPQEIYNEFSSGTADVSAFRKLMKMWYDRDMESAGKQTIKYCLIMSRPTYDNKMVTPTVKNAGYPRVPIWQSPTGFTDNSSFSTDDFIGMLEDTESFLMGREKINVAVGRFPVRSAEEANTAADKLVAYSTNPGKGSWRNNVLLIADDQDNGQHLDQSEKLYAQVSNVSKGADYQYERLYLDNFKQELMSVGLEYPEAKKKLLSKFDEGQALVSYIGHANTVSWTHEHLLTWQDFNSFSNTRLPILYAATCEFARWDADEYSGGELIWSFPKSGVIAMICPSRAVYISMNGPLSAQFGKYALVRNDDGTPTRLGDSYANTKNGMTGTDDNKLRYCLLGDPAMRMPVYSYDVNALEIAGTDVTQPEIDAPIIQARSNPVVKGNVTDSDGNVAEDFNGHVYFKLYDAEKVIETLGNGKEGKVMFYNDRTTKLYEGVAKVENGKWQSTVYMPSEIENNFTPGRITFYALADDGREANGATTDFYVYGYDNSATADDRGPDIIRFVLNHDNFKDGDVTYKTPVVYATFFDESGINLSEAGIGHTLSLTLDGKTVYSDVINFYTPDFDDNRKGSIMYQLPEIPAGKHSLTLTVWDCANNSSYATLNFNVAAVKNPDIYGISTELNADRSGVEFIINSDRPMASLACDVEVFDINGIRVWHSSTNERTDSNSDLRMTWDYTTPTGARVSQGIYVIRATVTSPEGKTAKKSKKIVVSK